MKNSSQQGFIVPLIIIIIAALAVGGGAYYYSHKSIVPLNTNTSNNTVSTHILLNASTTKQATNDHPTVSSTQTKSEVGLEGQWKLYSNSAKNFQINYPNIWVVDALSNSQTVLVKPKSFIRGEQNPEPWNISFLKMLPSDTAIAAIKKVVSDSHHDQNLIFTIEQTTIDSNPAAKVIVSDAASKTLRIDVFTNKNNQTLVITAYSHFDGFEKFYKETLEA